MKFMDEKAYLSNDVIHNWTEQAVRLYEKKAGKRADNIVKLSLAIEELLLRFRETYGTKEICHFIGYTKFGKIYFEISQKGLAKDCLEIEEDLQQAYDILTRMGQKPEYTYKEKGSINKVIYSYPKKTMKNKMLIQIFVAIALAFVSSIVFRKMPGSEGIVEVMTKGILPKCCAILSAIATPLVFLAVIDGITGLGDMTSFGKIGSKSCLNMLKGYGLSVLVMLLMVILLFPISLSNGANQGSIGLQLFQLVLDIIPNNLVDPFVKDNALQVIVIAIFVGFVMLLLGEQVNSIKKFLSECTTLVYKMMGFACKLIPAVVYLGIFNLLMNSQMDLIISMYRMFLMTFVGGFILILIISTKTVLKVKVPFKVLFKKMWPTLLINLTTSSQVSALPENMICCKEKFGINAKMVDFGLPFGIVTYMPVGAIFMASSVLGLAFIYNQPITIAMLVKVLIVSVIVAIAAPPIPGSALIVLPIMLNCCGLSTEYMSLGVIFGTAAGYFLPAFNGYLLQLLMLDTGKSLNLVDDEKLRKEW